MVTRYKVSGAPDGGWEVDDHKDGSYVLYEDYQALADSLSDETRDAARYRAIRGLITHILEDEAGIQGVAFSYQIPLAVMQSATEEELLDAVADVAAEMDKAEATK